MKKYYYFILLIFSIANHTIGITQCGWQPVGPNNFNQPSYSSTSNASLVTDHKGSVYTISTLSNPTLVQLTKYTGNIWQQFPLFDAFDMDIMHWSCTIDSSGAPYFAYIDGTTPTPNYLSVIKYNGSKWVFVGAEGFSPGVAAFPSIATDKTGIPYVAYIDVTTGKIPVRKYSGTSWIYVGSSGGVTAQNSGEPSLAFNSSGTLYMAFTDGNYKGKATVMQYNGTNWVNVGTPGFSLSDADSIQLKISDHDTLYVAFKDWANSKKLTVMKFNGINWVTIGTAGFTKASGVCFSLAIDTTETPWVSFLDHSNNEKANLVKYTGGSWTNITPTHILNDSNYSCINFNSSGVPYFLYQTNFHVGDLARVLKYDTIWHEAGDTSLCESSGAESILSDDSGNVFISYFDYYKRATSVEECKHGTNSWTFVGKQAFASGVSVLTLDKQGIPYVAFSDPVSGKASVMEFQDTAWVYIGPPQFTSGKASPYGIAVDAGGVPYIVMSDFNTGYYASVMKFNGTNWVYVDIPGFSNITFQNIILGINKANNIYVTYNNKFQYYNGTHFVDYSGKFYDSLSTEVLSLTFDSLGSPYLTYHDQAGLCSVSRYNGTHWDSVGPYHLSKSITNPQVEINKNGIPYISVSDQTANNKASLQMFDGKQWVYAGPKGFPYYSDYVHIAVDPNGIIYALFMDPFTIDDWVLKYSDPGVIFNLPKTALCIDSGSITLSAIPAGGVYTGTGVTGNTFNPKASGVGNFSISYSYTNSNSCMSSITNNLQVDSCSVLGIQPVNALSSALVSPNPSHGIFNFSIRNTSTGNFINIYNILGEKIYNSTLILNTATIDLSNQPAGVYFYRILSKEGKVFSSGKIIIN